jgi:hypothetical protein
MTDLTRPIARLTRRLVSLPRRVRYYRAARLPWRLALAAAWRVS